MPSFPPELASGAAVRLFVRSFLTRHPNLAPTDVVVLLTHELTVNAIVHTAQPFDVDLSVDPLCVEVVVTE